MLGPVGGLWGTNGSCLLAWRGPSFLRNLNKTRPPLGRTVGPPLTHHNARRPFFFTLPQWAFTIFCQISNQLRIVHIFVNTLGGPLVLMPLSGCTKAPTVAVLNCAKVSQPRNICPTACATYTSCLSTKSHHTWSLMAIIFR